MAHLKGIIMIDYSFDTGISTGIAEFDRRRKTCKLMTLNSDQLKDFVESCEFNPFKCIIEKIPRNSSFELVRINNLVIDRCRQLKIYPELITPSQWKPVSIARKWKCTRASTQHEKDALNLLRYFYFKYSGYSLPEEEICEWL